MTNWIRTKKSKPCPICGKPDWCEISADGTTVYCMRIPSDHPCKSDQGGWFHRISEPILFKPRFVKPPPLPVVTDFTSETERYIDNITSYDVPSKILGVSARSLERLQLGHNGHGYTFPMRDGRENIIGIRVRGTKGKWSVPGSRNGLFWPEGVYSGSDWPLVICEGPTDCAALLDLEFDAIGRPSCSGGNEHVMEFLRGKRRDVIVMADNDEPKERPDGSVWFPGQEGASRLAYQIKSLVRTVKVCHPPQHKDIREWKMAGATKQVVMVIIKNARYVA
ncbi:MAG: toprim domain-containing protein [Sedimentisphaerales bacterium]|nr:toprim domain-containing protein [Sedimentisphaerales bacterium]